MSLPIYDSIEEGIRDIFGNNVSVTSKSYVGGGDINDSSLLTLSDGERVFLKANSIEKADFFRAEESGINAIAKTGVINVPELLFRGTDSDKNVSYLCMRYISAGDRREDFWEDFGHKLSKMHLSDTKSFTIEGTYGFTEDNYIGATYQLNESRNTWCEFFRDCRLKPQLKMADRYFDNRIRNYIDRLLNNLPSLLSEPTTPSLIHGDLWSGN